MMNGEQWRLFSVVLVLNTLGLLFAIIAHQLAITYTLKINAHLGALVIKNGRNN